MLHVAARPRVRDGTCFPMKRQLRLLQILMFVWNRAVKQFIQNLPNLGTVPGMGQVWTGYGSVQETELIAGEASHSAILLKHKSWVQIKKARVNREFNRKREISELPKTISSKSRKQIAYAHINKNFPPFRSRTLDLWAFKSMMCFPFFHPLTPPFVYLTRELSQ